MALPQPDTTQGTAAVASPAAAPDDASPGAAAVPNPAASSEDVSLGTAAISIPAAAPDDASLETAAVPSPAASSDDASLSAAVSLHAARSAPSDRSHPAAAASEGDHHQHTAATDKSMLSVDSCVVTCAVSTGPDACAVPTKRGVPTGTKASLATGQTPYRIHHERVMGFTWV